MSESIRWALLGGYSVACLTLWTYFPALVQTTGQTLAEVLFKNPGSLSRHALFCALVASVLHAVKIFCYYLYYRGEYAETVMSLSVHQRNTLTTVRWGIFRSFGLMLLFAAIIIASMTHKNFRPSESMFDFIVIALVAYVVVEGVTEFMKFIPFFQHIEHQRGKNL